MLSARNRRAQLNRFVTAVKTVRPSIAAPPQCHASTIVTFELMRRARTVCLIRTVRAIIVTVADVPIVDAQILIRTLEFGIRHTRHIAIVFVTEIRAIVHAVTALGARYATAVRASELRLRAISHRAIGFVTFVHTIEMIIAIPSAGNAFATSASASGGREKEWNNMYNTFGIRLENG